MYPVEYSWRVERFSVSGIYLRRGIQCLEAKIGGVFFSRVRNYARPGGGDTVGISIDMVYDAPAYMDR